jgi:hypothetical protein
VCSPSTGAPQNIDEITGYIAFVNQQPLSAVKVGDSLYKVINGIARNPFAFRECQELAATHPSSGRFAGADNPSPQVNFQFV